MGLPTDTARGSLRFSLAHMSTADDVDRVGTAIGGVVDMRRAGGLVASGAGA